MGKNKVRITLYVYRDDAEEFRRMMNEINANRVWRKEKIDQAEAFRIMVDLFRRYKFDELRRY